MLRTPNQFEPRLDVELSDDVIAHVFLRDALIQSVDAPQPLRWQVFQALGFRAHRVHSIGEHQGRAHVAIGLDDDLNPGELPPGWRAAGLRSWFGVLDDQTLSIAMRGVQLLEWDRTHRFCGACGTSTERTPGERAKRCPNCSLTVYPRICPAMMVLVTRGRELLLGRGVNFPPGRYSALAGFLEAGESIEDAVLREVKEEVGLNVTDLRYFGSQSWPFPNSLMIAFTARYLDGELRPDPAELADAQWFSLDRLPQLPPPLSISRALIDATVARLTGDQPER